MLYFLCFVLLTQALCCKILKYNTRYCISKPHYLSLTGPLHSSPSKESSKEKIDYFIPKWVYKKVFKFNRPNKYNS